MNNIDLVRVPSRDMFAANMVHRRLQRIMRDFVKDLLSGVYMDAVFEDGALLPCKCVVDIQLTVLVLQVRSSCRGGACGVAAYFPVVFLGASSGVMAQRAAELASATRPDASALVAPFKTHRAPLRSFPPSGRVSSISDRSARTCIVRCPRSPLFIDFLRCFSASFLRLCPSLS